MVIFVPSGAVNALHVFFFLKRKLNSNPKEFPRKKIPNPTPGNVVNRAFQEIRLYA